MTEFNSKEYAFVNMSVSYLGTKISTLRGLKFKVTKEKEALYATGNKPHSIQHGNKAYEGELKILQSGLKQLNDAALAAGYEDVTDFAFDISVAFSPKKITGQSKIERFILVGAEVTEFELGMEQGDKFAEVTLPLIALDVKKV